MTRLYPCHPGVNVVRTAIAHPLIYCLLRNVLRKETETSQHYAVVIVRALHLLTLLIYIIQDTDGLKETFVEQVLQEELEGKEAMDVHGQAIQEINSPPPPPTSSGQASSASSPPGQASNTSSCSSLLYSLMLMYDKCRSTRSYTTASSSKPHDETPEDGNAKSLLWILNTLRTMNEKIKTIVDVHWNANHTSGVQEKEAKEKRAMLAKRKLLSRERATLKMKKQQEAFMQQMLVDEEDDEDVSSVPGPDSHLPLVSTPKTPAEEVSADVFPDCSMCHATNLDSHNVLQSLPRIEPRML